MASKLGNGRAHVLEISNRASVQKLNLEDVAGITASLDNHYSGLNINAHQINNIAGLQTELNSKAAASHSHSIGNITGLQSALDTKADDSDLVLKADAFSGYTGSFSVVTGVNFAGQTVTTKTITVDNGIITSVV